MEFWPSWSSYSISAFSKLISEGTLVIVKLSRDAPKEAVELSPPWGTPTDG